jgi:hypothetical protein
MKKHDAAMGDLDEQMHPDARFSSMNLSRPFVLLAIVGIFCSYAFEHLEQARLCDPTSFVRVGCQMILLQRCPRSH